MTSCVWNEIVIVSSIHFLNEAYLNVSLCWSCGFHHMYSSFYIWSYTIYCEANNPTIHIYMHVCHSCDLCTLCIKHAENSTAILAAFQSPCAYFLSPLYFCAFFLSFLFCSLPNDLGFTSGLTGAGQMIDVFWLVYSSSLQICMNHFHDQIVCECTVADTHADTGKAALHSHAR